MLRNCSRLECIVNEKVGYFYCDIDTPLPVVKEMIFQFQKYIGLVEDQIRVQKEAKQAEDDAQEEAEVEQIIGE